MKSKWNPSLVRKISLGLGCVAALVLLVMLVAGVFRDRIPPDAGERSWEPPAAFLAPVTVSVEEVEDRLVEQFPGTVRAIREASVSSRLVSDVTEVLKRPGDRVKAGDAMIVLDSRDLVARAEQAREGSVAAKAKLDEADRYLQRMQSAAEGNAVSRSAYEAAEASYRAALAERESALRRLDEARVNLSYARIVAPFDGIVIDRFVEPGDVASPGLPLLKLYDPQRLRLETFVRESIAVHLKGGQDVDVRLETLALRVKGKVEEIVPQAEPGSRSFLIKVGLPEADKLYPGMFGRLLIEAGSRKRLLVPRRALLEIGQLRYVVLADGKHSRRMVVPGEAVDDRVEILSGLQAGERILAPSGEDG